MNFTTPIVISLLSLLSKPMVNPSADFSGGPYCGVYCVFSAARMLQSPIPFEDLLQTRFIGSYRGSTARELQKACEENGLKATPLSGLSSASLQNSEYPVILHVRRPGRKMPFMHWVLFSGVQNGHARIIDPPGKVELISFSELSSLWDGIGIVVSTNSTTNFALKATSLFEMFMLVICVGLLLCLLMLAGSSKRRGGTLSFACLIPATGILAGLIYHVCSSEGLFRNPSAVAQVRIQHFQPDIPIIEQSELVGLIPSSRVSVIDARTAIDYRNGHIPGAVNLPIYSGLSERRKLCNSIPTSHRVIVYCMSSGCVWADSIATDLYHRGYKNIAIYRGGWVDWVNHE